MIIITHYLESAKRMIKMTVNSFVIGILLAAILMPSIASSIGVHFGPMFIYTVGNKVHDYSYSYPKSSLILGGCAYFPLKKYVGIILEGGVKFSKGNSGKYKKDYFIFGSGARIYPFPGKLGCINPYVSATMGLGFESLYDNFFYGRFNLGISFNIKKIHLTPYLDCGLYLGFGSITNPMFNASCGFLF